jgi:hypothetical protein
MGYGLDSRGLGVRFSALATDFSPLHSVQTGCEAHPASYPTGTERPLPMDKAAAV